MKTETKDPRIKVICDKASTLYNLAFSLGGAIAPILGGLLNDLIGFRSTSDIMAVCAFITFIGYLIFGIMMHKPHKDETKSFSEDRPRERAASSFHITGGMLRGGALVERPVDRSEDPAFESESDEDT